MASHHLIDAYLDELSGRLPPDAIDELADGLCETWHNHLNRGLEPTEAAQSAIAEFGTPPQVVAAFVAQAGGRRTARLLLTSGPVVGACWAASLISAKVWTWNISAVAAAGFALGLLIVVGCLVAAAANPHNLRRTRLGHPGAVGVLALDLAMVAVALLVAPVLVWPMAVAVPASLIRIGVILYRVVPPGRT